LIVFLNRKQDSKYEEDVQKVLEQLRTICSSVCSSPFQVFPFGSYNLGVHNVKGGDIDILCLSASPALGHDQFFNSIKESLSKREDVTSIRVFHLQTLPLKLLR
jgi:poly(A) polymerase Pap1